MRTEINGTRPVQSCAADCKDGVRWIEVDARGLEPPQPLVQILEAIAALPAGARLLARTDRRPMHLYAILAQKGFAADTQPEADGSFVTRICSAQ